MNNKLNYILFGVGLAATIDYNGLNTPVMKMIATACFAILFIFSIGRENIFKNRTFKSFLGFYAGTCFVSAFLNILTDNQFDLFNMEIAVPLMVTYSAYCLFDIERDKIHWFFLPICIFSAYCAIKTILQGLGAFRIFEYGEVELAKNQIGAAYTTIAIICAIFFMENRMLWKKITYAGLSILNMFPAIYFGCRTAQICYVLVVAYVMFKSYGSKAFFLIPSILLIVAILGGESLKSLLYDSFIGNRDVNNADDMTSGRYSRIGESFYYFMQHPLFGFWGSGDGFDKMPDNVHMFVLYRLTKWGIVGSIPFLGLYFKFFKIFLQSIKDRELLVIGTLLIAYVESLAEYAPPFGPGSCFIPVFFLVGYYLRNQKCN